MGQQVETQRVRFTEQTWAALGGPGITRETSPRHWTNEHDLAVEAFEARQDIGLPFEAYRELVSAAGSGLPLIIRHRAGSLGEVTRTYIVEQFMSYRAGTTANLYVRAWGFAYPIALSDIVSVKAPRAVYGDAEVQR